MNTRTRLMALAICLLTIFTYLTGATFPNAARADGYVPATIFVSEKGGTLHLRSQASTTSASLGIINHGDNALVLESGAEWSKIFLYRLSTEGYVKTKYIMREKPRFIDERVEPERLSSAMYEGDGTFLADLDGDGALEQITLQTVYVSEYDSHVGLAVKTASGTRYTLSSYIQHGATLTFAYLDDVSGRIYMFLSGDECSGDYITYCLYLDDSGLVSVDFAHPSPLLSGDISQGVVHVVDEGVITLSAIINVLGTRSMSRTYRLVNGAIQYEPNDLWRADYAILDDPEFWLYAAITLKAAIPVTLYGADAILPAGTALVVTAIDDDMRRAYFVTANGAQGYISYEMDEEYWGVRIGGVNEEDLFEELHYAG